MQKRELEEKLLAVQKEQTEEQERQEVDRNYSIIQQAEQFARTSEDPPALPKSPASTLSEDSSSSSNDSKTIVETDKPEQQTVEGTTFHSADENNNLSVEKMLRNPDTLLGYVNKESE